MRRYDTIAAVEVWYRDIEAIGRPADGCSSVIATPPSTNSTSKPWCTLPTVSRVMKAARMRWPSVRCLAAALLLTACGGEATTSGPVTIKAQVVLGADAGTFEVTEGADVLGCSSGTFLDMSETHDIRDADLTCESGEKAGTFSVMFWRQQSGAEEAGTWTIVGGTGDFSGLQGGGEYSDLFHVHEDTVAATFAGDIEHRS